ncbi:MAG: NAD(P)H:quinone oxidoreductase [Hydrogenophaga sp.]|uniref:NAD(P)H:quinone oxidoreductase n=1 Tax=Hydrogenophaga sp. TaxID=1904254 RepID=UPI001D97E936|nr:NAD(P)H:quinone oxidoreductase [Hydrogenophaga sp.]MBX3608334.1 NAD(P)H:quinone oxidoreductase [Hydrogenophaga sp.]
MTRVLVLYYSSYGHVRTMAQAVADGASRVPGVQVDVRRVPETVPLSVRERAGFVPDDTAEMAVQDLPQYDAIILGTPTHFGTMAGAVKQFIDQAGGLWARNALAGKVGAVFTSTGSQHGGHEMTVLSTHIPLLHFGMVIVGMPYTFSGQTRHDEIAGGSPYGAGTIAGADGSRRPTANDLAGARFQGEHVARVAAALVAAPHETPNEAPQESQQAELV